MDDFTEAEIAAFKAKQRLNPETGCLEWTGSIQKPSKTNLSYGLVYFRNRQMGAHRLALMMKIGGPIPPGMWALHSCHNPRCTNPDHLRVGTPKENALDMVAAGRATGGGHPVLTREDVEGMAATGLHLAALERLTGRQHKTIRKAFERFGVPVPPRARNLGGNRRDEAFFRKLAKSGLPSMRAMARAFECNQKTVAKGFRQFGIPLPEKTASNGFRYMSKDFCIAAMLGHTSVPDAARAAGVPAQSLRNALYRHGLDVPRSPRSGRPPKNKSNPTQPIQGA